MLEGASGIVTGASDGIGRATADSLAAAGVSLTITARREAKLESLAKTLRDRHGVDVQPVGADIRDPSAVEHLVETAQKRFSELDLVVHNAGIGVSSTISALSDEAFQRIIETNVMGAFYLTREVLPALRASNGTIVYVGSYAGQFPFPVNPVYAGTKGWLRQFAHSLEAREGDRGVAVSIVNPGAVRTDFAFGDGPTQRERYEPGEAPEPEEIAAAIRFVCARSDAATVHELDLYPRDQLSTD